MNVNIPKLKKGYIEISLVGDTSLLTNRFSEKAKQTMLDVQEKKAKQGRAKRVPWNDYVESMYWLSDKPKKVTEKDIEEATFGFPAIGFKASAVRAANDAGMKMTEARRMFHVDSEFVVIETPNGPRMNEDTVRIGMGKTDLRFRGEFVDWTATFVISYNAGVISMEQVVNLFEIAGFGVGVGEHRPERNGINGRFHVAKENEA